MFNIKRIGIILSVLALVALAGGLMASPVLAKKPQSKHAKYAICHYEGPEYILDLSDTDNPHLDHLHLDPLTNMWYVRKISNDSVQDHFDNHGFGTEPDEQSDTMIGPLGDPQAPVWEVGGTTTTTELCIAQSFGVPTVPSIIPVV